MPIYEKSTKELMHEFAAQKLKPGQEFSYEDAIRWFAEHYPKISDNTVGKHVHGMSVNTRRDSLTSAKPGTGWDLFFKLGSSKFRLWNPGGDPAPRYGAGVVQDITEETEEDDLGSSEFAFEQDLQNYLVKNLVLLEPGLQLYEDKNRGLSGVEFPAGKRYIDILAVGTDGAYVVIETKVSRAYDKVAGQILRYMGWVRENLAGKASVRGIIVASEISEDLILATSSIESIRLVEYEISFSLKPVSGQ